MTLGSSFRREWDYVESYMDDLIRIVGLSMVLVMLSSCLSGLGMCANYVDELVMLGGFMLGIYLVS